MRAFLVLLMLATTSCGARSGTKAPGAVVAESIRVDGVEGTALQANTFVSNDANTFQLLQPIEKVWGAMSAVYEALGVPVNQFDPTSHTVAASNVKVRRRLGKVPLSRYLDCGNAQGVPSADTYEINLTMLTTLKPGATGTIASTTVEALGRSISMNGTWIRCSSLGLLERRLAETLHASLR
jgi:hypothetical protein